MENHLIIGIDNQGENVVKGFRQQMMRQFGTDQQGSSSIIDYLFLDCDTESSLVSKVHSLQQRSATEDVTFHIVASLGELVEVKCVAKLVKIIRQRFPDYRGYSSVTFFRIFLYLELPSTSDERLSQKVHNELSQLNNIAISSEPFHRAYIYNKVKESNKVADFLFWKIIECEGFLRCECDEYYTHGMTVPANDGNPALSLRFMTFGFCRVETCEREFVEYAASSLAQQTAQLIAGEGHSELAIEKYEIERLLLSDDYLTLCKPTPKEEHQGRNWHPIIHDMEMGTEQFKQDVMNEYQSRQWIAEFDHICDEYYNQCYRVYGVEKFYMNEKDEIISIAHEIINRIEAVVYRKWLHGEFTANDVCDYVTIIENYCSQRISYFQEKINECQQRLNGELLQEKEELLQRWNDMGWFHIVLTGCNKKIFETYSHVKCESMIVSAQICAYQFAISLVKEIIQNLGWLHEYISQLKQAIIYFAVYAGNRANAEMSEIEKESDGLWQICKKEEFLKAIDKYSGNMEALRERAEAFHTIIASHANTDDNTFQQLACSFNEDVYEEAINRCKEELYDNKKLCKYLHKDIYSALCETVCTNDSGTEAFAKEMLQRAQLQVTWNQYEIKHAYNAEPFYKTNVIMMPNAYGDAASELRSVLIDKLSQIEPNFKKGGDILSGYRNSITLVSLSWGFPYKYILPNEFNMFS